MRRFLFLSVALLALNTAGLLYIASRSPAPVTNQTPIEKLRIVAFSPTGDVADEAKQDRLTVVFDEPVVTKDRVGDRLPQVPFVVEPALPGYWSWAERDQLAFTLESPLPAGRTYEVKPGPNAVAALGRELVGETDFSFATRRLRVVGCELLSQDRSHATIRLGFNQRVEVGEVLDYLSITRPGSDDVYEVKPVSDWLEDRSDESEDDANVILRVARRSLPSGTRNADQLLVRLKPGLAGDGATRGLKVAWEKRLELDPRLAFRNVYVPQPNLEEVLTVRLRFTRPLDATQGRPDFDISPAVEGLKATYSRSELRLVGRFEPGRRYKIDLGPGLRAANGEALGERVSITAEVPDRRERLGFAVSRGFLMPTGNLLLDLKAVNLSGSGVKVSAWRVHENNLLHHLRGGAVDSTSRSLPGAQFPVALERNAVGEFALDLRSALADGENVPPGIYRVDARSQGTGWVRDSVVVAVTDLALTAKRERDGYLVWVSSLATAQPVGGVEVVALSQNNQRLVTVKTDADGFALLPVADQHPDGGVWAITAKLGTDRSFLQPERRPVMVDDVDQSGRPHAEHYEALVYAERGVYRPGDTLHLTSIVRTAVGGLPPEMPMVLTVTRPDGRVIEELPIEVKRDAQGVAQVDWTSGDDAQLGRYKFALTTPDGHTVGQATALVESFEPVRIAVEAKPSADYVGPGDPLLAEVSARYLFGQPAAGLATRVTPTFRRVSFASERYPDYRFDDDLAGQQVQGKEIKAELDDEGAALIDVPLSVLDAHRPGRWSLRAGVTVNQDGGRSVSSGIASVVDTSSRYVGLSGPCIDRGANYVGVGVPMEHHWVCVTGEDTDAQAGAVRIVLSRVQRDVLLEEVRGKMVWRSVETLEEVEAWSFDDVAESAFTLKCDLPGAYELRAIDRHSGSETRVRFYAAQYAAEYQALAADTPERVELALDQEDYQPGDSAELLIRSAFTGDATALVTVETDRVLHHQVIALEGGAGKLTLPVDDAIRGGAFVVVSVVRPVDVGGSDWLPHRALGMIRLETTHAGQRVAMTIQALAEARPGEQVTVTLTTDARREQSRVFPLFEGIQRLGAQENAAARGAASSADRPAAVAHIWAVDEGILMTTAHQTPDAHGFFFARRRGAVRMTDLFADLLPDHARPADMSRIGAGGDGDYVAMRRSPVARPRHDPAVVWRTAVPLEADGTVSASFKMPELNGEMRLMAVVVDGDRYGSADQSLTLASPLMVEASWPRFAAPGDVFDVPVKVFNNTDTPVETALRIDIDGPLTVAPEALKSTLKIEANGSATRWIQVTAAADATGPASVDVVAEATIQSGAVELSHQRATLSVRAAGALQSRTQLVRIQPGQPVELDPLAGMIPGTRHLRLRISGNPAVNLMPAVDQLVDYPYGCAEQTVGRLLALLSMPDLIDDAATADGALEPSQRAEQVRRMVQAGIHRLWGMQTRSGGIAYWPGGTDPAPWVSAYVGWFLLEADRAGYDVDERLHEPLMDYLERELNARRGSNSMPDTTKALVCRVLTGFGRAQHGWAGALEAQPDTLDMAARAHLAACLLELGRRDRATALMDADLLAAKINPTTTGRLTSLARQEAVMLEVLLSLDPKHDWVPILAERLNRAMQDGHWGTTLSNAAAIHALSRYQRALGPPAPFTGELKTSDGKVTRFNHSAPLSVDTHDPDGPMTIRTTGEGTAYIAVVAEGVLPAQAVVERDQNLIVRRRWLDRLGEPIDPLALHVGDLIYVELTVQTTEDAPQQSIHNLAIVDALPGGMEIENPRLATSAGDAAMPLGAYGRTQFLDDRVLLFISASRNERTYRYALRVVTPGSFALPPVQGSCMYDASVSSVHGAGRVKVAR